MPPEFQKAVSHQLMQEHSIILWESPLRPALQEAGKEGTMLKMPFALLSHTPQTCLV